MKKLKSENDSLRKDKQKFKGKLSKTIKQRDKLQKVIKLLLNNFSSCKKVGFWLILTKFPLESRRAG